MTGCSRRSLLAAAVFAVRSRASESEGKPQIQAALQRLYNFDFPAANRILDAQIQSEPQDPTAHAFRSASLLFQELDRLGILEGQFLADDERLVDKRKLEADPRVRREFYEHIEAARRRARHRLVTQPNDVYSLFAMCVSAGLVTDYVGLVERRHLGSLQHAKESYGYATRLLKLDPDFTDAYMTTGITEYLLGSVPFFVRWFVRFDDAQGDKSVAERNLRKVVATGRYLGPFGKIMLSIICIREKRPEECERLLSELSRDFPENPLFRRELQSVRAKLRSNR